jgi:hypothetical protein
LGRANPRFPFRAVLSVESRFTGFDSAIRLFWIESHSGDLRSD